MRAQYQKLFYFLVQDSIRKVAYKLALSFELLSMHNVFHASMLKKYVSHPSHVLTQEPIEVHEDIIYEENPVKILGSQDKRLRNKIIPLVKI